MKSYKDATVEYHLTANTEHRITVTFSGKASLQGTENFITWIEEELVDRPHQSLQIILDLCALSSVPIRSQLRMASWILGVKGRVANVAIVGGGRGARALAKGSNMTNVQFFTDAQKAATSLEAAK